LTPAATQYVAEAQATACIRPGPPDGAGTGCSFHACPFQWAASIADCREPTTLPWEPIAVQAVAVGQDTLDSSFSAVGELGVGCRAQVFPFQRMATVTCLAGGVAASPSPTAVHAAGEEQDTAFSSLSSLDSMRDSGVGVILQVLPFQCSARVPF